MEGKRALWINIATKSLDKWDKGSNLLFYQLFSERKHWVSFSRVKKEVWTHSFHQEASGWEQIGKQDLWCISVISGVWLLVCFFPISCFRQLFVSHGFRWLIIQSTRQQECILQFFTFPVYCTESPSWDWEIENSSWVYAERLMVQTLKDRKLRMNSGNML